MRIGHLTPRTGFLGPLGEYAVMGVNLAVEEINAAGGIMGRKIELIAEDSVNPQTASTKAERLIERDKVVAIIGEISSASGLAIAQVAQRNRTLFFNTGCNSDELRGKACNRFMFHTEAANSMYVGAEGQALLRDGMVKGKKWYSLTADYAFGHDLLRVAKRFMAANGGEFAADELVPTDVADFSPYLLKIRNAKPDVVVSNLAGNQIGNFMKQYLEFALPFPVVGFAFDTAVAWGVGKGNVLGTWPLVWDSQVKTPSSQRFVEAFVKMNSIVGGKGVNDGVVQYWFDGQLVIDHHDVLLRTAANAAMQFNQLVIAPYIGDGSPVTQTLWIDNLTVATGRP